MNMLAQAQGVCGSTEGRDEDMVDYINVLRESVLDAYSGIVQVGDVVETSEVIRSWHCSIGTLVSDVGYLGVAV